MTHPYSSARGVSNTRVQNYDDETLAEMRARFRKPVVVATTVEEYHAGTKREKSRLKMSLPYFVGGSIKGKRHDSNVTARTLLTLDIEAKDGQEQPPPPKEAFDALEGLGHEGWVYTSLGHTKAKPRYRVVLPLDEPIEGADLNEEVMRATTRAAARKLGLHDWCTPESWVLSQPMYLPAKLADGVYWECYASGDEWSPVYRPAPEKDGPADIPDALPDPVLHALQKAGLYLKEDPKHKGKHYITCPFVDLHGVENETQTVYYEAHHDGNPRPAVKCFDTEPDVDGHPHLTYRTLVNWLRDNGFLKKSEENSDTATALEDYETFAAKAGIGQYLNHTPEEREFAWDRFAPVGKVTVLAGPGGVSKSMLMLTLMAYGALGQSWGGFNVTGPLRGLYVSYEDDTLELHKRVNRLSSSLKEADGGIADMLHDVDGALRKNMLLYAADDDTMSWLLMSKFDQRSAPERTARVEWLVGFVRYAKIKVLVVDPVVYTHNLEESSPGDMALYMQTLTYIAKQGNCAVVVLHHMHKTAQWATVEDINQGSLRGASSFADNSRSVAVLFSMPVKDAPRFGLPADHDTVSSYAVFKHVKHNYSASMGTVLFQRNGPMLAPRTDIKMLSQSEAHEKMEEAKAAGRSKTLEQKAGIVLGWLLDQDGGVASTNMIRTGTNIRYALFKEVIKFCTDNLWLTSEPGPNRIVFYSVNKEGKLWLKDQEKKQKKGGQRA